MISRHFTKLAVDAVLRLKGSGNLKAIQIIKISGGLLEESFLDEGFLLNKKVKKKNNKIAILNPKAFTQRMC